MENKLPKNIPVFPLSNVVFFPKTNLPLNIFEKRYLQLVKDCLTNDRLFGMVQSKRISSRETYNVGCLGKITSFHETNDGRYIINLTGISRFKILKELENSKLYREFNVDYAIFSQDTQNKKEINFEISNIINSAKIFFKKKSYDLNWDELNILDSDQQINTIIMISPFSIEEKQILLETIHIKDKLDILKKIFQFYLLELIEPKSLQ